jgi:plastocyanin
MEPDRTKPGAPSIAKVSPLKVEPQREGNANMTLEEEARATETEVDETGHGATTRRRLIAGAAMLAASGALVETRTFATDGEDDDDNSGPGGGGDNSGPGGGDDDEDDDDDHGLPPEQNEQVRTTTVRIVDERFEPNNIAIETGQTVTWINDDDDQHTASGRGMDSGVINPGSQGTVRFLEPGEFNYTCNFHPEMLGLVTVTGDSLATPADATPSDNEAPSSAAVEIVDFAFEPAVAQVAVGGTVTWTNTGAAPHTVLAEWADSGILDPGATFEFTFDQEGKFDYQCGLHPAMTGSIEVVSAQGTDAGTPIAGTVEIEGVWVQYYDLDNPDLLPSPAALAHYRADGSLVVDFTSIRGDTALTNGHGRWEPRDGGSIATEWFVLLERAEGDGFEILTISEEISIAGDGTSTGDLQLGVTTEADGSSETSGTLRGQRLSWDANGD